MSGHARRAQNIWIDTDESFVAAAWFWPTTDAACSTAVVIVPGIAHEERTMLGGLVALAESLADHGLPALLLDLHGCSQSAGSLEDHDIAAQWDADIRAAVRHARGCGVSRIIVVATRLGVPLAVRALADEPLAALIAWAPIVSGKWYVRELKVLHGAGGAERDANGSLAIGGFSVPLKLLDHIASLNLEAIEALDADYVMLREMPAGLPAPWLSRLSQRGVKTQEQISTQIEPWLFGDADQPALPFDDIQAIARWCRALHDAKRSITEHSPSRSPSNDSHALMHQGRKIVETFVEIAPHGLTGVVTAPASGHSRDPVRLLVSTVGPGRTFTKFARDEASRGNMSLRFDFAGFGTSGRGGSAQGGELYVDAGRCDVQSAIAHLRQAGHDRIYGIGFCAGAWSMIQAQEQAELLAAVAINVALYWQPGAGAPSVVSQTRQRFARFSPALVRSRLLRGVAARLRHTPSKRRAPVDWLVRLCSADIPVMLAYAEGDPGLDYLKGQITSGACEGLRRPFDLRTYPGLGHLAEGPSARARLFDEIAQFLAGLDQEASTSAGEVQTAASA